MMPTPSSLFGNDFQQILDAAKANAGAKAGPFPSPMDWRDLPIYFLMVDRFAGTNPINHVPFDDPNFSLGHRRRVRRASSTSTS
jgi:hypothetical protein